MNICTLTVHCTVFQLPSLARIYLLLYWNVICDPSFMWTHNEYFRRCRRLTKKLQPLHFLLWTEFSARQVYVLLHTEQWCILLMILLTSAFFIIVMLFFSFLSMFKVKHLPLTDITQHSNQSIFWDRRDAGRVLIFIIFYMEKPFFFNMPTIQYD